MKLRIVGLVIVLAGVATGAAVIAKPASTPDPTATSTVFVQRYANATELAPVATIAAEHCGQPYFGTYCR